MKYKKPHIELSPEGHVRNSKKNNSSLLYFLMTSLLRLDFIVCYISPFFQIVSVSWAPAFEGPLDVSEVNLN